MAKKLYCVHTNCEMKPYRTYTEILKLYGVSPDDSFHYDIEMRSMVDPKDYVNLYQLAEGEDYRLGLKLAIEERERVINGKIRQEEGQKGQPKVVVAKEENQKKGTVVRGRKK